jgi:hypothetical protein
MSRPLKVACVWVGDKYPPEYVANLYRSVRLHLGRPFTFSVVSDRPPPLLSTAHTEWVRARRYLPGWWAKMQLFEPVWRMAHDVLYLDLDTAVVGDLSPLADVANDLALCANFTRAAGNARWPCRYGSCVMFLRTTLGDDVWRRFEANREWIMKECGRLGDQKAIEMLTAGRQDVGLLQDLMPSPDFFLGYRDLPRHPSGPPPGCSLVIFAGREKPHNTRTDWARRAWRGP